MIWRFTLVFMKSYADKSIVIAEIDEIKWQSHTGQLVLKSKGLYRTSGHFTGLVRRYFVFTAFYSSILQNDHLYWWTIKKFIAMSSSTKTVFFQRKFYFTGFSRFIQNEQFLHILIKIFSSLKTHYVKIIQSWLGNSLGVGQLHPPFKMAPIT